MARHLASRGWQSSRRHRSHERLFSLSALQICARPPVFAFCFLPPPLRMSLSNDALSCVFGFLDGASLHHSLQCCTRWLRVLSSFSAPFCTIGDRHNRGAYRSPPPVSALIRSPLACRHLGAVLLDLCLDAAEVTLLSQHLLVLHELRCGINYRNLKAVPPQWRFPPTLRRLSVDVHASFVAHAKLRAEYVTLVAGIAQLSKLEDLLLWIRSQQLQAGAVDLAPLAALPALSKLSFYLALSESVAQALRSFPALRCLLFQHSREAEPDFGVREQHQVTFMQHLTATPHTLQLQEIDVSCTWRDPMAKAMARVPTLTKLSAHLGVSSFQFLDSFRDLTALNIGALYMPPHLSPMQLALCISRCSLLTNLAIHMVPFNSDQLAVALRGLPRLDHLSLGLVNHLESFRCFRECAATLSQSLTYLYFYWVVHPGLTPADVEHLRVLTSLEWLELIIFKAGVDKETCKAFTPPSSALPKLKHFRVG